MISVFQTELNGMSDIQLEHQQQGQFTLKSSTHNHINTPPWAHDKRVEALIKQEMVEHQHIISSHHKEMQTLRDSLALAMERFDSLFEHCDMQLKDMALFYNQQLISLRDKVVGNEVRIADQQKTIEALHQQINGFHESYASKRSIEKLKSDFDLAIKENTISHINSFQEFQIELKSLINSLSQDLIKLRCDTALMNGELDEKIKNSFHISRLERDSVLKQVRVYEKAMFVIEKKIENIYTLIERINKRGEVCHKQG